ncbi:MAG: O-antigen ligase family protein [Phascolarctobacterium sp.]|nr:O-antigen ligase family protein [Phascolarctobacterium sp.]
MFNLVFMERYNIKGLAFFLIGLGVAIEKGVFLAIAALIALVIAFFDRQGFSNIHNKYFNKTLILFLIYVGTLALLCLMNWDIHDLKLVLRNFEKIASFLIVYLLLGKTKNAFLFGSLGFIIGVLMGEASVLQGYFAQTSLLDNRFGGTYGHPNSLGSVMELTIPFLIYAIYKFRDRLYYACIGGVTLLSSCACLLISGSRGAQLAVIGEICVLLAIYCYRRYKIKSCSKCILLASFAIAALILLFIHYSPRKYDFERVLLWRAAWEMFLDHPVVGVGYDDWNSVYKTAYISPLAKEPDLPHCHNFYLHLLSTTGIIGTIAYFSFLFGQIKMTIKNSINEYKLFDSNLNIADMFGAIICGMLIHNAVDINVIWRYYMLKMFFFWALCCLRFQELEDYDFVTPEVNLANRRER